MCEVWRAKVTDKQPVTPPMPTTLISSNEPTPSIEHTAVALPRVLEDYAMPGDDTGEVKLFTWH